VNRLLFENAELFDPEEGQPVQASLLVESGRIRARVSAGEPVSEDVRRIDLAGLSLAPGFLDLHFHGEFVFASSASLPALLERTSRSLLEFGTTGYLVTSVAWPGLFMSPPPAQIRSTPVRHRIFGRLPSPDASLTHCGEALLNHPPWMGARRFLPGLFPGDGGLGIVSPRPRPCREKFTTQGPALATIRNLQIAERGHNLATP